MRLPWLRIVLILDAAVLLALGLLLMGDPVLALRLFHFDSLPSSVTYIIGIMGCLFASLSLEYAMAATDPLRYRVWVQVAMLRGALECGFGLVCVMRGLVTMQEAGFGIGMGAGIVILYAVLYPRLPTADATLKGCSIW